MKLDLEPEERALRQMAAFPLSLSRPCPVRECAAQEGQACRRFTGHLDIWCTPHHSRIWPGEYDKFIRLSDEWGP